MAKLILMRTINEELGIIFYVEAERIPELSFFFILNHLFIELCLKVNS